MRDQLTLAQETIDTLNTTAAKQLSEKEVIQAHCKTLQTELNQSKGIKSSIT